MRRVHVIVFQPAAPYFLSLWTLLLCFLLVACDFTEHSRTINSAVTNQSLNYSTNSTDVVIRTFYGGGNYGSFSPGPQISIYGDGTYIIGLNKQGQISADTLQHLLSTLVDTYDLLQIKHQQFIDLPDQNATFLELTLNGKIHEFVYGTFGNQPQSPQAMHEYQQLGSAITTINDTLQGPTHSYHPRAYAFLVRPTISYDATQIQPYWNLRDFTLNQLAIFECGPLPQDFDFNRETGCLKYTVPNRVLLLNDRQQQSIRALLRGSMEGTMNENGNYYEVRLRPLLPDELGSKALAMFGSAQSSYKNIPIYIGPLPH